jgi:hypothetical protein
MIASIFWLAPQPDQLMEGFLGAPSGDGQADRIMNIVGREIE